MINKIFYDTFNTKDCKGLFPLNAIELITSNCTQLSSLYILNVKISEDAVNHLLNFLNPNIECLSFGYGHVVEDSHVEILVKRFKKIKQLGIKSRRISNLTVDHIVNNLKGTLRLLHLEAENIFCEKLKLDFSNYLHISIVVKNISLIIRLIDLTYICFRGKILY